MAAIYSEECEAKMKAGHPKVAGFLLLETANDHGGRANPHNVVFGAPGDDAQAAAHAPGT
ncbi:hypothetical protein [Paraburkholderia phenazinium]|jgi:hypothetical protein|uniref:Uncharacterized protein n=1 Tax=Paraburkholderia phenazinium TaxID=60549 RepID=A0A1G8AV26_9BURK|nr:hypothetical protein [Paraburkholderia phenazinium]SDH24778.1 hypothetical protein SAMN05216466_108109 [Paraburkholderia phenazinium]